MFDSGLPRSSSGTVDFYENSSIILFESTNEKKEEDMNRFLFFNKNYNEPTREVIQNVI